ncbi:class I SAM-dependent methyltransferase [Mycobacterium sp. Aquia_216]|uniref:class I SAM-dependent methyltransferase n=1 Tax=Mycobacterium sp. Aquia_216 TaxID=2991729 RepID=UPI00227A0175|nr:class I SAM-dependent methyltransferase [Mycobacterium sp. Aquia_216]WAJ46419.1 class I SAM-dependent methyltransferase [Mycobacterium sp. Aquia_216]
MIPDDPAEWKALASRQLPLPFFGTHYAMALARAIMAATKLGVFESLSREAATPAEIARRCGTDTVATQKLLVALAGSDYLQYCDGRYTLTPNARTWLLTGSPRSIVDVVLFAFDEWELMTHVEDYVRTGVPLELHQTMTGVQWDHYQRSMRALAGLTAHEVAEVIPVPSGATDMIDVGGSHGHYSVALCRRHPHLRSVVLDLPEAVRVSAPLLATEQMGARVAHLEADALTHDFGVESYDVVLLCNLAHHLSAAENAMLFRRLGRALRPRGVFAMIEPLRLEPGYGASQFAALNELYFGVTSRSGTWTASDTAGWQRDAGLQPAAEPVTLSGGDIGLQIATKI